MRERVHGIGGRLGRIEQIVTENSGQRLTIAWPGLPAVEPLAVGESVAVSGCCLTVVAADGVNFDVQAGPETLDRTNLGSEEPAIASISSGHSKSAPGWVDISSRDISTRPPCSATAGRRASGNSSPSTSIRPGPPCSSPRARLPSTASASRWSTSGPMPSRSCSFPHTMAMTTLGSIRPGDHINIEVDMLAKHVQKLLGTSNQ